MLDGRKKSCTLIAIAFAVAFPALPPGEALATDEQRDGDLVTQHLTAREDALLRQYKAARTLARQHAWLAYRLNRRRRLGFFASAEGRRDDARAADESLVVLRRSLDETHKIAHELELTRKDRTRFAEQGDVAPPPVGELVANGKPPTRFDWPITGSVVVPHGLRTDPMTGVELRETGIQVLASVDAPVRAPAAGQVHRIQRLGEGGYALVLAHGGGYTTILSGVRQVRVALGARVAAGRVLGNVGRTLDAAPVVRVGVWKGTEALNPEQVFRR